jgi:hypothetical protein
LLKNVFVVVRGGPTACVHVKIRQKDVKFAPYDSILLLLEITWPCKLRKQCLNKRFTCDDIFDIKIKALRVEIPSPLPS